MPTALAGRDTMGTIPMEYSFGSVSSPIANPVLNRRLAAYD